MGTNIWPCILVLSLSCLLHCSADTKLPSAMVVGTVVCNTCFQQESSKSSHLITGASVAVQCGDATTKSSFRKVVQTNWRGVFRVRLPTQIGKHIKTIQSCSVTLMKSSDPFCAVTSSAASINLRLKSIRNGIHVFSAGFFTFKPLKQPEMCYQKPKASAASRKAQPAFFLPPVPLLPPPTIGGVPIPPNPLQPPLLPNPLQPPPSVLPPVPFLPSPPPSFLPPLPSLPPVPFLPSPPPSFLPPLPSLPPVPFLTPPPPPPTFPLPPFPFLPPPNPLFPGIPPGSPSKAKTP